MRMARPTPPANLPFYDWSEHHRKQSKRKELDDECKKNPALRKDPEFRRQYQELAPDPDYRLYNTFKVLQADGGANKALVATTRPEWPSELRAALHALRDRTGDLPNLRLGATGNQLMNPLVAKGIYFLKPSGTKRDNPSIEDSGDSQSLQYLRYGGYFSAAVPFSVGKGDVRLLCAVPSDISLRALEVALHSSISRGLKPCRSRDA